MKTIHSSLSKRYPWYQKWHEYKGHVAIHWIIFTITMVFLSTMFLRAVAIDRSAIVNNPPSVNIISPADGSVITSNTVPLTFTTTGNPTSCWYDMGDDIVHSLPNCNNTTLNLINYDYYITVHVENSAGSDFSSSTFRVANATDTVKPVITNFLLPSTSAALTVPINAFSATDNNAVVAYKLTQNSNTPSFNSGGWVPNPPTSYVFTTPGTKTLYAWTKDAGGNISLSSMQQVTVGVTNDTTPPTINSFTLPSTYTSLTVPVTISANDNIAVTGYKISESSTIPTTSWLTTAPTSYTFSNTGEKKLYVWARDAAGNVSASSSATTMLSFHFYYLSPSGNDSNSCTLTSPCLSLNKVWPSLVAGDTVYMRGGTYAFDSQQYLQSKSGNSNDMIRVWNYPNEIPILSKSASYAANYGIYFSGNYVHFKGLEISGYAQKTSANGGGNVSYGLISVGSNYCKFERLNVHDNGAGLYIQGSTASTGGVSTGNQVINSDFHHNQDPYTVGGGGPYGNASGLSINRITSGTNTVTGSRFWWNTDEGMDTWLNDGVVIVDNSWAWFNGYIPDTFTPAGDGDGFKLGKSITDHPSTILRTIRNVISYKNKLNGFDDNIATGSTGSVMEFYNNTSYLNGNTGFNMNTNTYPHIAKNNIAYGNGFRQAMFEASSILSNNTFTLNAQVQNPSYVVTNGDFQSLDDSLLSSPRQTDGSLPNISFLHLSSGSDLINSGVNVGLPYNGSAPDLGAFETN